jgi:hypothetical protein
MGNLPNVKITLGNGKLGRSSSTPDGVAGMILTAAAVPDKLLLNKHYQISSTRDLTVLGIDAQANPLADKDIRAFYAQAGDGAELHLLFVPQATTLTAICDTDVDSPLSKLINAAGGRIRIVGVNKLPPSGYTPDLAQGIDGDAVTAAAAAHLCAESLAGTIKPFRLLMPAPSWTGVTENLYKPRESSYNRVGFILASDDAANNTAAIGQVLGRAAKAEPQQNIGRVKSGSIAPGGYFTDGSAYLDKAGLAESLHDAGYIFYRSFPTKNGCYLNDDNMAAAYSDDYGCLANGRIIDKAYVITYMVYIEEILDELAVDEKGKIPEGACRSYEGMIRNAIYNQMGRQISSFRAFVDPDQNPLSTSELRVSAEIVPKATLRKILVDLSFRNPQLTN